MSGLLERFARRPHAASREGAAPSSEPASGPPPANSDTSVALHSATNPGVNGGVADGSPPNPQPAATDAAPATEIAITEAVDAPPTAPGFRERGRLRRRARHLRQVREIQLRDIGGLTLELHRFGRERRDLIQAKVEDAARTDAELRGLERALDGEASIRELREAGIGGACRACRAVHGSTDRFCASCGEPIHAGDEPQDDPGAADEST
jgi:hypothetical protein